MSKVKAHLDRFFGDGAILEGAPSKLYFAVALAVIGTTLIAPPQAKAEEIELGMAASSATEWSYDAFLADLQAKVDPSRILIFDPNVPTVKFDTAASGSEPICLVIPAPTELTVDKFFSLKGADIVNTGSITDLDVQKFVTLAKVGQCLTSAPSLAQGAAFATFMTSLDPSISPDLVPTLIAFNEYDAWTDQASLGKIGYDADALRSANAMLADPAVHFDLRHWNLEEVATLAADVMIGDENAYRTALRAAMTRTGVSSADGISAQWLTDARIIPEVEHIRDLREFLIADAAERELPSQYAPNELKLRVFTNVLHDQGDATATAIGNALGFDLDDPTAKVSRHWLEVNGLAEPEADETNSGPRI